MTHFPGILVSPPMRRAGHELLLTRLFEIRASSLRRSFMISLTVWVLDWFGARVVRILQDFAGICRVSCLILFVFRVR